MPTLAEHTAQNPQRTLSLYHLLDPEMIADPYPLYRRLRENDPVYWDPYLCAWVVTSYNEALQAFLQCSADRTITPEQFRAMNLPQFCPVAEVMARQMLFMDPPMHTRLRTLASRAFMPAQVEKLRSHIREVAENLLANLQDNREFDLMTGFADLLPGIVVSEIFGLPLSDFDRLKAWALDFAEVLGNFQHNPDRLGRLLRTAREWSSYFQNAIDERRRASQQDFVQGMMDAEEGGDRLSDDEIVANCILVFIAGLETTTNLIGTGMISLLKNPRELDRLRKHPSIIQSGVEELLRYEAPSQVTGRIAPHDIQLGGKQIKGKQALLVVMGAANRDPARFPDPDCLDLTRPDNRHLSFGWAAHFCFGAYLARIEAQIAFTALLRRFSSIQLADGPLTWKSNLGLRGLRTFPVRVET